MTQSSPLLVLGVDPGTRRTGFGIITLEPKPSPTEHGIINPKASLPLELRLHLIHQALLELIKEFAPAIIAVETPFFGKSAKSSMAVGQAQAVALVAGASQQIPLLKFTPAEVKQRTTGHGNATKEQVRFAVQAILKIDGHLDTDRADALAIALCAAAEQSVLKETLPEPTRQGRRPTRKRPPAQRTDRTRARPEIPAGPGTA